MSSFLKLMEAGGEFMWLILVCQLLSIAIMLERFYAVLYRYNVNGTDLFGKVKKSILANKAKTALAVCDSKPTAALSQVIKSGLMSLDKSIDDIEKAIDQGALQAVQLISRRTPYLNSLSNVATLLGLLGTIFGLIDSFESVGAATAEERQHLLAAGISVAMYTTAYGLIVAVPCIIAFSIIQNKAAAIVDDIDRYSGQLLDMIRASKEGAAAAPSRDAVEEE